MLSFMRTSFAYSLTLFMLFEVAFIRCLLPQGFGRQKASIHNLMEEILNFL